MLTRKIVSAVAVASLAGAVVPSVTASETSSAGTYSAARKFSDNLAIEFSDHSIAGLPSLEDVALRTKGVLGFASSRIELVSRLSARFLVYQVVGARSDADIASLVNLLKSTPGIKNVEMDPLLRTHSEDLYNDPGWAAQFSRINSKPQDNVYNPKVPEAMVLSDSLDLSGLTVMVADEIFTRNIADLSPSRFPNQIDLGQREYDRDVYRPEGMARKAHGDGVLGTLAALKNNGAGAVGMIPSADFLLAKMFHDDPEKSGSSFNIVYALQYAMGVKSLMVPFGSPQKALVANISLGTSQGTCPSFIQEAVDDFVNAGGILIASVGNGRDKFVTAPAGCSNVVAVGAVNRAFKKESFSNYGPTMVTSTLGKDLIIADEAPIGYRAAFGTSYSTPIITAFVALAKAANPSLTAQQAISAIRATNFAFSNDDPICAGTTACGGVFNPDGFLREAASLTLPAIAPVSAQESASPQESPTPSSENTAPSPDLENQAPAPESTAGPSQEPPNHDAANQNTEPQGVRSSLAVGSIATDIDMVEIFNEAGRPDENSQVVAVRHDGFDLVLGSDGRYTITFFGKPTSNTTTQTVSRQRYAVQKEVQGGKVIYVSNVEPVANNQDPATFNPQQTATEPQSPSPETRNSPGGSLGLATLLGMSTLLGFMNRSESARPNNPDQSNQRGKP